MYSRNHALLSAVLGIVLVAASPSDVSAPLLWTAVVCLGVGIDVDHFLLARLNRGDWHNLRRCLRRPRLVVTDQRSIFEPGDLWRDQRLLSHALIGGLFTTVFWPFDRFWAIAVAATLYVHVVADLWSDVTTRERYLRESVRDALD